MKQFLCLFFIVLNAYAWGQTTVKFGYDQTGNRTSSLIVKAYADSLSKSKDDNSLTNLISVYPTPTLNSVFIKFTSKLISDSHASLCSTNGNILIDIRLEKNITEIDLHGFSSGIYILNIYCNDKSNSWKIIKQM